MINIILGNGLEGYGVVNYAINITRALGAYGQKAQLVAYPTGKYSKPQAYDFDNIAINDRYISGDMIFVSLPQAPEQIRLYEHHVAKCDGSISFFIVDRQAHRVENTIRALPVIPELSSLVTFESDPNYLDWQTLVGKTKIIPNHTLAVFEEDFATTKKQDMLIFTGRFSPYKQPALGVDIFQQYFMHNNWSYAHAASLPHIEVKRLLSIASAGVFASEWRGKPIVENALIEMIASGTVPIMQTAAAIDFAGSNPLSKGVVTTTDLRNGHIGIDNLKELRVDKSLLLPYGKEAVAKLALEALCR